MRNNTYLDKTVGRVTIPEISDCEPLAIRDLFHVHGEEGDGVLLGALVAP